MKKVFISLLIAATLVIATPFAEKAQAATNVSQYVDRLYQVFLQREPDAAGKKDWQTRLEKRELTLADVTYIFIDSDEFKSRNYTNEQYLTMIYKSMMNREPDANGFNYWLGQMNGGYSKKLILGAFFNSDELRNGVAGINANIGSVKVEPYDFQYSSAIFMKNLYNCLLRREPDQGGLTYWSNQIAQKNLSFIDAFQATVNSDEYKSRPLSNEEFVTALYKILLFRDPDQGGKDHWVETLNAGFSRNLVLGGFINSDEFNSFVNKTGLIKGNVQLSLSDIQPQIRNLVNRFYVGLLNRQADAGGLDNWTNQIIKNGTKPAAVIDGLVTSDEMKNQNISYDKYVSGVYKALFDRNPTTSEMNDALDKMINGYSRRYILYNLMNTQEFKDNMSSNWLNDPGTIQLNKDDMNYGQPVVGIVKFDLNLRTDKKMSARSADENDAKAGTKVTILEKVRGIDDVNSTNNGIPKGVDFYHIRFVKDGKVMEGYVVRLSNGTYGNSSLDIFNDDAQNQYLGALSETYESGGDAGRISSGVGDNGGKSYGAWQLSSKMGSLADFVSWLSDYNQDFFNRLNSAAVEDARNNNGNQYCDKFDAAWTYIAQNNYKTFYDLQHKFTKVTFYDPVVKYLMQTGDYDSRLKSYAVRNVIWSTAVQHGTGSTSSSPGAAYIISKFKDEKDINSFITKIYQERGKKNADGSLVYFWKNSADVQAGVAKRFVNESADALRFYGYEKTYLN